MGAALAGCLLLAAINLVRPVRDAIGAAMGVQSLPWLLTGTMLATLAVSPAVAWLVSRVGGRRAASLQAWAFALGMGMIGLVMATPWGRHHGGLDLVFFLTVGVFNLLIVSAFWALLGEVFENGRAERLFGLIAAGTTIGAIAGSAGASMLARAAPPWALVLGGAALAAGGAWRVARIGGRLEREAPGAMRPRATLAFEGATLVARSGFLRLLSLYLLLFSLSSTVMYFEQARIVGEALSDPARRAAALADIALAANTLTLLVQALITGRLIGRLGVGGALTITPGVTAAAFAALLISPALLTLACAQVLRLGVHYAVDRPARESLFARQPAEARYKAKSFIDTFVYRAGDLAGAWLAGLLPVLGVAALAVSVPIALVWLAVGLKLGTRERATPARPAPVTG
jgi:AAA family ATP:ADP antiporter